MAEQKNYDVTIHDLYLRDNDGENRYTKEYLFNKTADAIPMDRFQVRHFVVEQAHTPYKQILQCMMEIDSRKNSLKDHEFSMRELDADIAIYKERIENTPEGPQREKYQVKLERVEYNYEKKKDQRKKTEIEIGYLLEMYQELTNKLSFEDIENNREALELDYWKARMSKQAAVDLMSHGVVGVGNMLSIMDMGKDVMEETLSLTVERATQMREQLPNGIGKKLFALGQAEMKRELELEFTKAEAQQLLGLQNKEDFLDTVNINTSEEELYVTKDSTKE